MLGVKVEVTPVLGVKECPLLLERTMSRPASDYTLAIRTLLDERNGELTHNEARPLLEALGHEIAAECPAKSENFKQFEQYAVDLNDEDAVAKAMKACGFDEKTQKAVLREAKIRKEFKAESNDFNVIKYNWSKAKESGTPSPSRKPETSKNTKAKTAAVVGKTAGGEKKKRGPKPKHRRNAIVADFSDPLDVVSKNGGIAATQAKITAMREEADRLEAAVSSVMDLKKRVAAAA